MADATLLVSDNPFAIDFMSVSAITRVKPLLRGLAWLLFAIAALAFWVGGRVISAFTRTDSILAEMEGIVIAVVFAALGLLAKSAGEDLDDGGNA